MRGPRHSFAIALLGSLSLCAAVDLQAMLDASASVELPAGEYLLSSPLLLRHDNLSLTCAPGAVLSASGPLLIARNLANIYIDGCRFDGANAGANGTALLHFENLRNLTLTNLTIQNTVPGMYALLIAATTNARLENNRLEQIRGPGISIAEGSSEIEILNNSVDATASTNGALSGSAIEVKARAGSTSGITNVTIKSNKVRIATGFCFEAGQFGGTGPVNGIRIVDGNDCRVFSLPAANLNCSSPTIPKTCGGYSFDAVTDSEIIGNTYDATGQAVDIAAIELVRCRRCTASANVLAGDTSPTATGSAGISANCAACLISGNQVTRLGPVHANALIHLHTIPDFRNIDANAITGNTLILPEGGTGIKGVYLNCDHPGGSAIGTQINANRILGAAAAGQGITLAANSPSCAITGTEVLANSLSNLHTGLLTFRASNVTWGYNRLSSVQTPTLNDGGTTLLR